MLVGRRFVAQATAWEGSECPVTEDEVVGLLVVRLGERVMVVVVECSF